MVIRKDALPLWEVHIKTKQKTKFQLVKPDAQLPILLFIFMWPNIFFLLVCQVLTELFPC